MVDSKVIMWFRQDLRLEDNPALYEAFKRSLPIMPIFIFEETNEIRSIGEASRWWLYHSLRQLNYKLQGKLNFFKGSAHVVLNKIIQSNDILGIYWNRCYEPYYIRRDSKIEKIIKKQNIDVFSFNGSLLIEPNHLLKADNAPYKVFTPFYKKNYLATPEKIRKVCFSSNNLNLQKINSLCLEELDLLPKIKWYNNLAEFWTPGESGAYIELNKFIENGLKGYANNRDRVDIKCTSGLSAHLHFGEISPNTIWQRIQKLEKSDYNTHDINKFLTELGWREFSYNILYNFPQLSSKNLNQKFDTFPWENDLNKLYKWQKGITGYPIVDAGMRHLWKTGFIPNRVRMITASFLIKHLLIDWRYGERWFWDCLVDADLANNALNWQWVAGSGVDAAPYFRIFNPITQGQKFDPEGKYTRKYVPELEKLPNKYLFSPWEASSELLLKSGIILGKTYPIPIVDHQDARRRALEIFHKL